MSLPAWPNIGPCRPGWYSYPEIDEATKQKIHPYMVENREIGEWYHKDVYLAAMARLRVAVGILKRYECVETDDITAALRAIGDLPLAELSAEQQPGRGV